MFIRWAVRRESHACWALVVGEAPEGRRLREEEGRPKAEPGEGGKHRIGPVGDNKNSRNA